jgi:hypothetical protein
MHFGRVEDIDINVSEGPKRVLSMTLQTDCGECSVQLPEEALDDLIEKSFKAKKKMAERLTILLSAVK